MTEQFLPLRNTKNLLESGPWEIWVAVILRAFLDCRKMIITKSSFSRQRPTCIQSSDWIKIALFI